MNNRYVAKPEAGGDWQVVDTDNNIPVATGLNLDEAEETANARNATERSEKGQYI